MSTSPLDPQILDQTDRYSSTWAKLSEHFNERLRVLREKNDNVTLTSEQTIALRGQIKEIKYLLSLGNPPKPAQVTDAA